MKRAGRNNGQKTRDSKLKKTTVSSKSDIAFYLQDSIYFKYQIR